MSYGSLPLGGSLGSSKAGTFQRVAVQLAAGLAVVCVVLAITATVSMRGEAPVQTVSLMSAPEPIVGLDPSKTPQNKKGHMSLVEEVFHAEKSQLAKSQLKQLQAMTCGVGACSKDGGCDSKAFTECMNMDPEDRTDFVHAKMPHLKMMDGYLSALPGSENTVRDVNSDDKQAVLTKFSTSDVVANCGAGACTPEKGCDVEAFRHCMKDPVTGPKTKGVSAEKQNAMNMGMEYEEHQMKATHTSMLYEVPPQQLNFMEGYLGDMPAEPNNDIGELGTFPEDTSSKTCGVGACDPATGCDDQAFFACMRQLSSLPLQYQQEAAMRVKNEYVQLVREGSLAPQQISSDKCGVQACSRNGCDNAVFFGCLKQMSYANAQREMAQMGVLGGQPLVMVAA